MTLHEWIAVAVHLWWAWLALAVVIGADITYARSERRSAA